MDEKEKILFQEFNNQVLDLGEKLFEFLQLEDIRIILASISYVERSIILTEGWDRDKCYNYYKMKQQATDRFITNNLTQKKEET